MASIQGGRLMHLGYHEEQQILVLSFGGGVQIEGTSEGSEILAVSPHHLALLVCYTLPEECPQISFLLRLQPLQNSASSGSSFWAVAQSVTYISTRIHPVVTHTSFSNGWSFLMMAWFSPSALWEAPMVAPSRTACTASGSRWVVTQLKASATVLSCPFWYSNQKSYLARAPAHQCPVASKLGVVKMYVKGLLSVFTRKGWYRRIL